MFLCSANPAKAQQRVLGLDISAWQGNISQTTWNNIHNVEGRDFIILRSSRGGTTGYYNQNDSDNSDGLNTLSQRYDDPYYIQNMNRVTSAGMYAGSYHFSRPDIIASTFNANGIANTGTDEADHFIQMAGPWMRPGYLVPVHDFEAGNGLRTANEMAQFNIDFSDRIYQVMGIRPAIYTSGSYAGILQSSSLANRNLLAQPPANLPSVVSPAYPTLWSARWPNQTNPGSIDVQNSEPKDSYTPIYGPWDDYGVTHPWKFWQYASTMRLQSFNNGGSNLDVDAARGGIEFLKDQLVPAVWWNNFSGDWSVLTNWNSGQTPVMPDPGLGQVNPVGTLTLPTPRLPGASGSGVTSGQNDTVILERPNANITVTLSSGIHNIRKLYMRETLNITGGALTINYGPSADSTTNGAQFSGPVTLGGSGSLSVHTLQVDASQTFTLGGGTLTLDTINLMPHATTPAKILVSGNVNFNPLSDTAAAIDNGSGSGNSGLVDFGSGNRSLTIGNGASNVDLSINVPISNGGLTKSGPGTLRLKNANTYSGGTTVSAGTLLVNNTSGSGTGTGSVAVNGGTLAGTGIIGGPVIVNAAGTIAPGNVSGIGTLTLNAAPTLNGTNLIRIDVNGGSSLADKIALTTGTLTYGGKLIVTNIGAAPTGGEVFTNFSASAYAGSFTATNLPALTTGLNWYLGSLAVNGTIKVNRKPIVNGATFANNPGHVLQIAKASLVSSGTDPDNDSLTLASFDAVTANGITLTSDSTFIYYSNSLNVADEFNYTISDGRGGLTTGVAEIVLSLSNPPSIADHPDSTTIIAGENAMFTVVASGTQPLNYQWKFNGTNIAGATASTFTRLAAQPAHAGNYTVAITNSFGSTSSAPALLTINYSLTMSATSGGAVGKSPDEASYVSNAVVTLTATPDAGFSFTGWSGDASGSSNPLNVTMTTNKSVTANFSTSTTDLILDNDNPAVTFVGDWQIGTGSGKFGVDYRFAVTTNGGNTNVIYRPNISTEGFYDVLIWYPQGGNRSTNAPWTIVHASGSETIPVNQQINGSNWFQIASARPFLAGTNGHVELSVNGAGPTVIMADAVRFVYVGPLVLAPEITSEPASRTNSAGSSAVFSVTATGSGPLTYQWKKGVNNLANGGNVLGATSPSLTLTSVSQSDAGGYSVVVSNSAGTDTSLTAMLTVIDPPAITFGPESRTNNAGTIATFSVSATGSAPLNYQWRKGGVGLADGGNVSGANSPTLTLSAVYKSDQTNYDVVISNGGGSSTSSPATLMVIDPVITSHPANQTGSQGATVTFSVVAEGTAPLGYQWRKNNSPMSNGGNVAGATSANLTLSSITSADAASYSVTVTNLSGSVTSSNASLFVQAVDSRDPTISFTLPSKTTNGIIKLKGTAKDTAPGVVTEVWYRLNSAPGFSPATLSGNPLKPNWESPDVALNPGTNFVYAYAVDSGGNFSLTNSKKFFYDSTDMVTVNIIGGGEVKTSSGTLVGNGQEIPMLVGRPASLTAFIRSGTPATNYVFSNWFGAISTNAPTLNFIAGSNMVLTARFIPNPFVPVAGKYNGLFFSTNGVVSHETDGFITFKITGKAAYSGKILLDGNVVTLGGKFDLSGHATKTLSRAKFGKNSLTLNLDIDWSTSSQKVFGTIGDGTWLSNIEANYAAFGPTNLATAFVGRYTMLVPRTNYPSAAPGGFGYGLITNSLLGKIVLSGKTGDGAVLSQTTLLTKDGKWPFYVPLYRNTNVFTKSDYRGSMMGWIHFTGPSLAPTANDLSWIKTAVPATDSFNINYFYPAGFTNLFDVITSPFQPPLAGTRLLPFSSGSLLIADGNLPGPTAWSATLASNNTVAVSYSGTNKVTLTLNSKTGFMKGTFIHPNNGNATTTFYGAVMQDQNYAAGVFTGRTDLNSTTNQTGSVRFE